MIAVDASLVIEALTLDSGPSGDTLSTHADVLAPAHLDAEVGHALRGLVRGGLLQGAEASACLRDLAISRIGRVDLAPLLPRAFELRDNMTFCDALYVALAELHDVTLVTADAKFARVPGARCSIEVVR